ncbi:MAG: glutaredoxin family protein [Arenicellales bacterium]|nr:glutaredoxin family protein [Arenicellales bacterium]
MPSGELMPTGILDLYVRRNCHLCEDMHAQLVALQDEYRFSLKVHDVDQSPDWAYAYGEKVPLLMAADVEVCRYFLDLQAFKTYVGADATP